MININKQRFNNFNFVLQNQCTNSIPQLKILNKDAVSFCKNQTYMLQNLLGDFQNDNQYPSKLFNKLANLDDETFQKFLNLVKQTIDSSRSDNSGDILYGRLNALKGYLSEQNLPKGSMVAKTINEL